MSKIPVAELRKFRKAIAAYIESNEQGELRDLDEASLSLVLEWCEEGKLSLAYSQAAKMDTAVRDVIPGSVWSALLAAAE